MTAAETEELLLFIVGQLFRVECELSAIHTTVVSIRAGQVAGGFDTLVQDPLERRLSAGARRAACTAYEEALETIRSPALRAHVRAYVASWCADVEDEGTVGVRTPRRRRRRR